MKKIVLPIVIFVCGLVVAQFLFGVDIVGLTEGFIKFLGNILKGTAG